MRLRESVSAGTLSAATKNVCYFLVTFAHYLIVPPQVKKECEANEKLLSTTTSTLNDTRAQLESDNAQW